MNDDVHRVALLIPLQLDKASVEVSRISYHSNHFEMMQDYLDKLPMELWELVLGNVGTHLDQVQLTCRLFRDIAARMIWRNVEITSDRKAAPFTKKITFSNWRGLESISTVSCYIKKLTVDLSRYISSGDVTPTCLSAIKRAMASSCEVLLIVSHYILSCDFIGMELLRYVKVIDRPDKFTVRIKGFIDDTRHVGQLRQTISLLKSTTAAIEVDVYVSQPGSIDEQIGRYIRRLTLGFAFSPQQVEELLPLCPQVEHLTAGSSRPGRLVLPKNISDFELRTMTDTSGLLVVSSFHCTRLRIHASALKCNIELPNLRVLELVGLIAPVDERAITVLQALAKNVDRFVAEAGDSEALVQMAPCISQAKKIVLTEFVLSTDQLWDKYVCDLLVFLSQMRNAQKIHLGMPLFHPEGMEIVMGVILRLCPFVEELTTEVKSRAEICECYPFMHKSELAKGDTFEIDLQMTRSSDSSYLYWSHVDGIFNLVENCRAEGPLKAAQSPPFIKSSIPIE